MRKMLGLAAMALALAACGSSGGGGGGGGTVACNFAADGGCLEWSGASGAYAGYKAAFDAECTASNGGASVSSCPAAGRAGTCVVAVGAGTGAFTETYVFYTSHYTTVEAQQACTSLGGTLK